MDDLFSLSIFFSDPCESAIGSNVVANLAIIKPSLPVILLMVQKFLLPRPGMFLTRPDQTLVSVVGRLSSHHRMTSRGHTLHHGSREFLRAENEKN